MFKKYFIQFFLFFILIEILLRITGMFNTYSEQIGKGYHSYYNMVLDSWHYSWPPGEKYVMDQAEFNYTYQANSLGFRDREWEKTKSDSIKRLIVLGDSFTEGDGVPEGKNFPSFLEKILNAEKEKWEIYNGGVCGNDPFFNFKFIKTQLYKYDYDFLMLLINDSDITDYVFRGGLERFQNDSTTHYRKSPSWEPLYQYSHTVRFITDFLGIRSELLPPKKLKLEEQKAIRKIADLMKKTEALAHKKDAKFLVVIHPTTSIFDNDYYNQMEELRLFLLEHSINVVEIFSCLSQKLEGMNYEEYAWPINGHFNEIGYQFMAECIYKETQFILKAND